MPSDSPQSSPIHLLPLVATDVVRESFPQVSSTGESRALPLVRLPGSRGSVLSEGVRRIIRPGTLAQASILDGEERSSCAGGPRAVTGLSKECLCARLWLVAAQKGDSRCDSLTDTGLDGQPGRMC
jgi:hypothetical protein